jgi:hypothetical protein
MLLEDLGFLEGREGSKAGLTLQKVGELSPRNRQYYLKLVRRRIKKFEALLPESRLQEKRMLAKKLPRMFFQPKPLFAKAS